MLLDYQHMVSKENPEALQKAYHGIMLLNWNIYYAMRIYNLHN